MSSDKPINPEDQEHPEASKEAQGPGRAKPSGASGDEPTRLMPERGKGRDAGQADTSDAPTRILDREEPRTVLVDRAEADRQAADATRVLDSTKSSKSGSSGGAVPETNVSMPHLAPPAAPAETSVSVPMSPVVQVRAPRTGDSASPSSARTAGSAADRDELPKAGDYIKDRFELTEELGRGGMGAVFRARDVRKMEALDPDPYVAIKFISGSLIGFERAFVALQREAKNAQSLNHPNIVKVFDFDRDQNLVYLTMEVVEGIALHSRMRAAATNPMSAEERTRLVHGMLAGMAYAHSRDLSHADLKPSNMMIDSEGTLKILDFGIARRREYDKVFDADDLFALTIDYASPEMLNRQRPTPADDVYALGCIIYTMYAGAHPFNHVRADLARSEKMRPERPANISRVQWQALRKSLAFTREERFADAAEFQRAFEAPDWRKIGGVAAAVLAVLLVFGWFLADPVQSWMTVSGLDTEQAASLQRSLDDGSEYLDAGYAEDAVYAYAEALTLNPYSADARSGARSALGKLRSQMSTDQYRKYLASQQQEERNPAWLKDLVEAELASIPQP
ncbi:serine/threonine-protein kinase [Dokdonella sp.]|uniref:serine/threonine-protein kinase n=1 Tax=Dokdonella sp. TaxID=2291710 RepID=UPI0035298DEB